MVPANGSELILTRKDCAAEFAVHLNVTCPVVTLSSVISGAGSVLAALIDARLSYDCPPMDAKAAYPPVTGCVNVHPMDRSATIPGN